MVSANVTATKPGGPPAATPPKPAAAAWAESEGEEMPARLRATNPTRHPAPDPNPNPDPDPDPDPDPNLTLTLIPTLTLTLIPTLTLTLPLTRRGCAPSWRSRPRASSAEIRRPSRGGVQGPPGRWPPPRRLRLPPPFLPHACTHAG